MRRSRIARQLLSAALRADGELTSPAVLHDILNTAVGARETDTFLALLRAKERRRPLAQAERVAAAHALELAGVEASLPAAGNRSHRDVAWRCDAVATSANATLPLTARQADVTGRAMAAAAAPVLRAWAAARDSVSSDDLAAALREFVEGFAATTGIAETRASGRTALASDALALVMRLLAGSRPTDEALSASRAFFAEAVLEPLVAAPMARLMAQERLRAGAVDHRRGTTPRPSRRGPGHVVDAMDQRADLRDAVEVVLEAVALARLDELPAEWVLPAVSALDSLRGPIADAALLGHAEALAASVSRAAERRHSNGGSDDQSTGDETLRAVAADLTARIAALLEALPVFSDAATTSSSSRDKATAIDAAFVRAVEAHLGETIAPSLSTRAAHVACVAASDVDVGVEVLRRTIAELPRAKSSARDGLLIAEMNLAVLAPLCARDAEGDVDLAYSLLNAHKYYGMRVTKALIEPLLARLAPRGDSRVFNLVDVCTLFSGCAIDVEVLASMMECCRAANDPHRARTLLEILREDSPGIVARLPERAIADLRALKVLPDVPSSWAADALRGVDA